MDHGIHDRKIYLVHRNRKSLKKVLTQHPWRTTAILIFTKVGIKDLANLRGINLLNSAVKRVTKITTKINSLLTTGEGLGQEDLEQMLSS